MFRSDYYPEFNLEEKMDFSEELSVLEKYYFDEAVASEEKVDKEFKSLIVRMESFLKEYKKNVKCAENHNDLLDKIYESEREDEDDEEDEDEDDE